jgi:hypothetical protein
MARVAALEARALGPAGGLPISVFPALLAVGFRASGFRDSGFRSLGFRALGFPASGFRSPGFRGGYPPGAFGLGRAQPAL